MSKIIKEILKSLPPDKISDASFEGANIVLYTKDKEFFLNNEGTIRKIVDDIKKRIELRCDPSITADQEKSENAIRRILPAEAGIGNVIFDPQRSQVIIEAEKPGLAIGKQGSLLREIRAETFWVPMVRRTPAIRSTLIENIRGVLYQNSDQRRKFLHKVGERIYEEWVRDKREGWVRLSYLGSGREVGRSCILLQTGNSRVLLDCGINVATSDPAYAYPILEAPEFDIQKLDAVVLSHAHTDHCGFIPYLYKFGFKGPVYCTPPTRDISALLMLDGIKIQRGENREPLYASEHIKDFVMHTITLDYGEVTDITPDIRLTFYNAGHILGSAMAHLHIGNGLHNLLYSGDSKYGKTTLLDPAVTEFPRLETMMLESTYGGRDCVAVSKEESDENLAVVITETIARGGKVLIPTLGVGRSQEVMLIIVDLMRRKMLDVVPVFIDGMVWDVTAIHTAYPEYLNASIRKSIFHKDQNPFLHECFREVGSQKERMKIIEEGGPCVILATSGMLTGGPSVEYLRHLGDNPKNSLIFVSYQGEGSLGRRIQRGEREITFPAGGGKMEILPIRMSIHTIEGFSGHSNRQQLLNFIYRTSPRPKKVLVNHGENSRCLDLASSLHKMYRIETLAPRNLDAVRLR